MFHLRCLNLKITYDCTNKCQFCFSSYLKDIKISLDGLIKAVENGKNSGCNELVISGGEPTLYPDTIIKIMSLAEHIGYEKFIIQTNGSGLANNSDLLAFLNTLSKKKEVCISFSIHGHCTEIHDKMSSCDGAFELLIKAMDNIYHSSCKLYTNTVVSSFNIHHLKEIASLVSEYDPEIIQFSMMHLDKPSILSTGLLETVYAIHSLKGTVNSNVLKTEGIPFCLMYGMEECVGEAYWPESLDLYNKNNDYMHDFRQLDYGMRWKADSCSQCIMNEICTGIWKEHKNEFLNSGIHPIC